MDGDNTKVLVMDGGSDMVLVIDSDGGDGMDTFVGLDGGGHSGIVTDSDACKVPRMLEVPTRE